MKNRTIELEITITEDLEKLIYEYYDENNTIIDCQEIISKFTSLLGEQVMPQALQWLANISMNDIYDSILQEQPDENGLIWEKDGQARLYFTCNKNI